MTSADTKPDTPTVELKCHCGARHIIDVGAHRDPRGALVDLARGWQGRSAVTLRRWARSGRLVAYEVERRGLVSYESDLHAAIESGRVRVRVAAPDELDDPGYMPPGLVRGD